MRNRSRTTPFPALSGKSGYGQTSWTWASWVAANGSTSYGVRTKIDASTNPVLWLGAPAFLTSETMTDSTSASRLSKPVDHLKIVNNAVVWYLLAKRTNTQNPSGWFAGGYRIPPISVTSSNLPILSQYDTFALYNEAIDALRPQFKADIDMANFIVELKDFKRVSKLLFKVRKRVGGDEIDLVKNAANMTKGFVGRKDVTRTAAELQLINSFALKPLVRDAAQISLSLSKGQSSLERFNHQGTLGMRRHFKKVFPLSQTSYYHTHSVTGARLRTYTCTSVVYIASAKSFWRHEVDGSLDEFLQKWGLNLSPKTLWNALPFSFVVDYFLSVDQLMGSLSRNSGTSVQVKDFIYSFKRQVSTVTVLTKGQNTTLMSADLYSAHTLGTVPTYDAVLAPGEVPIASSSVASYTRTSAMPMPMGLGIVLPRFKWPSDIQMANLGALIRTAFK